MDQLIRLDPIRHAMNDGVVHVKHIQQEHIGTLTGRHLGIGNSKQQGLHCPNGFTDDNALLTGTPSIKQVSFGNREQLRGTTIQVTLLHTISFQVPRPLPQSPCPVFYCTGGMISRAIWSGRPHSAVRPASDETRRISLSKRAVFSLHTQSEYLLRSKLHAFPQRFDVST